ncbi:O-antigen ligase [Chitinophaga sp. CF118]|uniref:O-antigen ligase family protein n=1 Tax=Chitinophaga sp. CF118 TaxID=1884367 RepID=UPI0008F1AD23|nr:O-antigen ligase family protein [Chitinophaga sp. CF118]SFF06689.1 O-antigen ligase [Chitinophaga sp. CF118]
MQVIESRKEIIFNKLYLIFTGLLLISAILGGRFGSINSISTIALLVVWIAEGDFSTKWKRLKGSPLVYFTTFYFLLYVLSIWISKDKNQAFNLVQREFVIPIIFASKKTFKKEHIYFLLKLFVYGTFVWMSLASILAMKQYFTSGDASVFLYHALAYNVESSAIFASMLCVISVAVILFVPASARWKIVMYVFFTIWLLLLSSRMFLFIHLVISAVNLFTYLPRKYRAIPVGGIFAIVALLTFTNNPVKSRFQELELFHTSYLTQPTFNEGIYFDGLSLRLIYIRFSSEIMREHNSYLLGVGTGDAANLLRDKIRAYHMHIGDGSNSEKGGYLQYSFHNVYLESFVSFGIIGLLAVLMLYGYIGYAGIKNRMALLRDMCIIIFLSSFTDVIVINDQCDLSLILTVCCLSITLIQTDKNKYSEQHL